MHFSSKLHPKPVIFAQVSDGLRARVDVALLESEFAGKKDARRKTGARERELWKTPPYLGAHGAKKSPEGMLERVAWQVTSSYNCLKYMKYKTDQN